MLLATTLFATQLSAAYEPTPAELQKFLNAIEEAPPDTSVSTGSIEDHEKFLVLRVAHQNGLRLSSMDSAIIERSLAQRPVDSRVRMLEKICPQFAIQDIPDIDPGLFKIIMDDAIEDANAQNAERYAQLRENMSPAGYGSLNATIEDIIEHATRTNSNVMDIYDRDPKIVMWMIKQDCDDHKATTPGRVTPAR